MIFTGATNIARHILTAAARNLVPVTLELGGKSPVVISRSLIWSRRSSASWWAKHSMQVRSVGAGLSVVPEEKLEEVISLATQSVTDMYASLRDNDQYTAVINERHHKRLSTTLRMRSNAGVGYPAEPGQRGLQ